MKFTSEFFRLLLCSLMMSMQIFLLFSKSTFFIWLLLELNTFCVMGLLQCKMKDNNFAFSILASLWYFIINTLSSFLIFIGLLNKNLLLNLILGCFLKLGFFPLIFWVVFLYDKIEWRDIFMVGYVSKMGLFKILNDVIGVWYGSGNFYLMFITLMSYLVSLMGMYLHFNNLKFLVGWSSMGKLSLFVFCSLQKSFTSISMFYCYGMILFFFCYFFWNKNNSKSLLIALNYQFEYGNMMKIFTFLFLFVWLLGFPPCLMFFVKMLILDQGFFMLSYYFYLFLVMMIMIQNLIYLKVMNYMIYSFTSNRMNLYFSYTSIFFFLNIFFIKVIYFFL